MGFSKVVEARLWGVTAQDSTTGLLPAGDSSSGTFSGFANRLKGTLLWDEAAFILTELTVAGGATGGSYSVVLFTDAVAGYTGLPIAGISGLGPNTVGRVVLQNFHQSPGAPLPTHMTVTQDAAGGAIDFQLYAFAKQYRGTLGTPGAASAERVIQGNLLRGVSGFGFADSRGMTENATFALGTTGTALGLQRIRLWDRAFFWAVAGVSVAGTHDVAVVSTINGLTFTVASTVGVNGGPLSAAGEKLALRSNLFGQAPNPSHIIWTEVSAGGVSDARVVVLAKTGRGSLAKS